MHPVIEEMLATGRKARGIPYSPEMVKAKMRPVDPKSMTRRGVKLSNPQAHMEFAEEEGGEFIFEGDGHHFTTWEAFDTFEPEERLRCPYGVPGDLLYTREAWRTSKSYDHLTPKQLLAQNPQAPIKYEADGAVRGLLGEGEEWGRYRHARFMPREAARLWDELLAVKVERLQSISEEDAQAEGIHKYRDENCYKIYTPTTRFGTASPIESFQSLFVSINGPEPWERNEWVWALSFRRIEL